jgi:hypothetical protein
VPVGHQVNFFVMPADLPGLESAIRAAGDVCFLGDRSPTARPFELGTIAFRPAGEPPRLKCFIVRRQELPSVSTRFVAMENCWLVEDAKSPVVEFSPGLFAGSRLTRGRAYFAADLRFRHQQPDPGFVSWGDRMLTRIRKELTRRPESAPPWLYFGASAVQWIRDSGATLTGGATSFTIQGR